MYNELSRALNEAFMKNKKLLNTPDVFIEEVRSSTADSASIPDKTFETLKNALGNKLIAESLFIIDSATSLRHKANIADKIYLRSFVTILEDDLGMDSDTAMFTVIPNLFYILGLCVKPAKDDGKIIVTISNLNTEKGEKDKTERIRENTKPIKKESTKRKLDEEYYKANKPYRVSALVVKWIVVVVWVSFCGVFFLGVINPPDSPLAMLYSLLSLGLGGLAAFFPKITSSIIPMFDKHVEKEENLKIQIIQNLKHLGADKETGA